MYDLLIAYICLTRAYSIWFCLISLLFLTQNAVSDTDYDLKELQVYELELHVRYRSFAYFISNRFL